MAMKRGKETYPQLPPAPDDYPTFPDKSSWPVVFPELPPKVTEPETPPPDIEPETPPPTANPPPAQTRPNPRTGYSAY